MFGNNAECENRLQKYYKYFNCANLLREKSFFSTLCLRISQICTTFAGTNKTFFVMAKYILIAEEAERKLIKEYLPNLEPDWQVLVTGVGAFNVLRALRDIPRDAELINIGYAGSANFEIGSIVEVTESRLNHCLVKYPEPTFMLETDCRHLHVPAEQAHLQAVCYSGTDFVTSSDYQDCVFDMELAFIAGQGFIHLTAIKYVSDNLSLHTYREVGSGVEHR